LNQASLTDSGLENIAKAFESYPPTSHPPLTDASKWIVEAMPVPGLPDANGASAGVTGLVITVHGELSEHPRTTRMKTRSFDRTFTLGPGNTASGVRVLNDMLLLRSYGGTSAFPGAVQAQGQGEMTREQMVVEVGRLTGLNEAYSAMCLEQTGWRMDAALESFHAVKATIPAEAFAQ
jgi:nuclear RNA export factor